MALVNFVEDHYFMGYQSPNSSCIKILLMNQYSHNVDLKKCCGPQEPRLFIQELFLSSTRRASGVF